MFKSNNGSIRRESVEIFLHIITAIEYTKEVLANLISRYYTDVGEVLSEKNCRFINKSLKTTDRRPLAN